MNEVNIFHIPILCYHKIENRHEWGLNTVKPIEFKEQIAFLQDQGYHTTNFNQLLSNEIPTKPIIITFDDGYASVYHNAFPILQEFKFTAIIYIISSFIGLLNTWDVNFGGIYFKHLDENNILEMATAGIEFGTHGQTHRALTYLTEKEIKKELIDSRLKLQELTKQPILSLAYPFGMQNRIVRNIASEAGIRFGCIGVRLNHISKNALRLNRIPVYRTDSIRTLKSKLSNGIIHKLELTKLFFMSWPAHLTPIYQKVINKTTT
jgi:peptidoglycan/xylan/chitin deacetylase (PgdA/CDA1 family)